MYTQERIHQAILDAEFAFWQSISKSFPEIPSGDFPPDEAMLFEQAEERAVKVWIDMNTD